jgi:hypothetical protein
MSSSASLLRFPRRLPASAPTQSPRADELESMASLLEDLLPMFQTEHERQFYREVVESYRAAAREILQAS